MACAKRRRRKEQRAYEARVAAVRAIATAVRTVEPAACPITDISKLVASPLDVVKAGTASEPLRWVVASCSPMGETKAISGLRERRFCAYLPMQRFWRWTRDRKRVVERPLMVGYLFVGLNPRQSIHDLATIAGIDGVLETNGRAAVLDPWVIVQIGALEASGAFDHTGQKASPFHAGQKVKITGGQFIGWLARVVEINGDHLRVDLDGTIKGIVPLKEGQIAPADVKEAA